MNNLKRASMRIRKTTPLLLLLLFVTTALFSQTAEEKERIKRQRLRTIDLYHVSVGMDAQFNQNVYFSPKLSLGMGSFRNRVNADLGVKYMVGSSLFFEYDEFILIQQLPVFASVQCNLVSWEGNCVYIGAELAYHIPITASHHITSTGTIHTDNNLGLAHFSGRIKAGTRIDRWEGYLFYEYDFAPMMNQKYVYESPEYDYDILRGALFERTRYGISLSYNFIL